MKGMSSICCLFTIDDEHVLEENSVEDSRSPGTVCSAGLSGGDSSQHSQFQARHN